MTISIIASAFIFGIVGGLIPGPILTAIFANVISGGFLKSFRIIFLTILTEITIALFCLFTLSFFNPHSIPRGVSPGM